MFLSFFNCRLAVMSVCVVCLGGLNANAAASSREAAAASFDGQVMTVLHRFLH